jgi:hypothetical protein
VAHRGLVEEKQSQGAAPFLADGRPATPELGGGGIEERDLAVRIGRVDGDPQGVEEAAIPFDPTLGGTCRGCRRPFRAARDDAQEVSVE